MIYLFNMKNNNKINLNIIIIISLLRKLDNNVWKLK